ncbi:MAG: glycosyltransferase family 2 protein [Alphaproteobacteria bacterium]|nr:glycosyltransferase family 2 protein [Alphaproteobacteria bacterium]
MAVRPSRPLVAVVTPAFDGGRTLEATMACVQSQTYDRLVHVVVDNCSGDNTPDIIDRFRSKRIELVTRRNPQTVPLRDNWNRTLAAVPVGTDYVKILCADDLMRDDCIERFVAAAGVDSQVEAVLSDDVYGNAIRRASLPSEDPVFDGIVIARRILEGSINWAPTHHMFLRYHESDREADYFDGVPWQFDCGALVRSTLRGRLAYVREPIVYTRTHDHSVTNREVRARWLAYRLDGYDNLCRYGARCWDEATFARKRRMMRAYLLRIAAFHLAKGDWNCLRQFHADLARRQATAGFTDYIRAMLDWLPYKTWQRSWHIPWGPRMDEAGFLAQNARLPAPALAPAAFPNPGRPATHPESSTIPE